MKNIMRSIFLLSLGCSKNTVDSERLIRQAELNGLHFTDQADDADIIIINTCGFIADAKEESINEILAAAEKRHNGEIEALFVMGCLSALYSRELRAELPEVDHFFGTSDLEEIINVLGGSYRPSNIHERTLLTPPHYAWLKIAEGCNRTCSFCAIPKMRGRYRSEPIERLEKEASLLLKNGVRELNIISQDITQYGWDFDECSHLNDLLKKLAAQEFSWIRLLYAYPLHFPLDVIDTMREHANICNYLDMPVQHISDRILKSMQRGIDKKGTIGLLESIRKKNPDIRLRTTMIVGYPGETDREFDELLEFVAQLRFDRLGCFPYSHEEHTSAFKHLEDDIPEKIKKERVEALMELQESIAADRNRELEGRVMKILVDEVEGSIAYGRTEYDAPEVDNDVLVDIGDNPVQPGDFCTVTIEESSAYELHGRVKSC